jgi:hypothetical protein
LVFDLIDACCFAALAALPEDFAFFDAAAFLYFS